MPKTIRILGFFILLSNLAAAPLSHPQADPTQTSPPPGFVLVTASIGVQLYRKDYTEGNPDYVQVIDLGKGASIHLLHGEVMKPGQNRGSYGGDNPSLLSRALEDYWRDFSSGNPNAFCVTNGQFFFLPEYPTKLALPLKVDGEHLTGGFGYEQYPWNKLMLEIWDDRVDIRRLSRWNLYTSQAPNIIAGLTDEANKKPNSFTGRTFAGIDDGDGDGDYETLLLFNTLTARQQDAAQVLKSFGAEKVIMLDGGGSTQLICQGDDLVESDRFIPQAIAVTRGEGPPFAGTIQELPQFPVLLEGESVAISMEIENSGADTWKAGEVKIVLDNSPWAPNQEFLLERDTLPGESVLFTWTIPANAKGGVHASTMYLDRAGQKHTIAPVDIHVIILPRKLEHKQEELQSKINSWAKRSSDQIVRLSSQWILDNSFEAPSRASISQVSEDASPSAATARDLLLIPLSVVLLFAILYFGIRSRIIRD